MYAQHSEGFFSVSDALGLEVAWGQFKEMLQHGDLQLPEHWKPLPPPEFNSTTWDDLHRPNVKQEIKMAGQFITENIISGQIPIWIAPIEGTIPERQIAPSSFINFGLMILDNGRYPYINSQGRMCESHPFFIKHSDWKRFLDSLSVFSPPESLSKSKPCQSSLKPLKPGPARHKVVVEACANVLASCLAARYSKPISGDGGTEAIKMLIQDEIAKLSENRVSRSDKSLRKYAQEIIDKLPDK